jgi:hypothetical protein
MSQVTIQGNANGNGTLTIAAPNTNSDYTLTLPAETGTMVVTDGTTLYVDNVSNEVGIGTASPSATLNVVENNANTTTTSGGTVTVYNSNASGRSKILIQNSAQTASGSIYYDTGVGGLTLQGDTGAILQFNTSGANERMRIDTNGSLIVGTTAATANAEKLNVSRSGSSLRVVHFENLRNQSGDENLRIALGSNCNNTSSYSLICSTGGTDRLYIYGNGNVVNSNNSYGSLSDVAIKENIVDATPKLNDLMQVRVRNYNLIADETKTKQIGVVAQELEKVFPSMVETDGLFGHKQVKYSVFVPMLIKAIQELKAELDAAKERIVALEGGA